MEELTLGELKALREREASSANNTNDVVERRREWEENDDDDDINKGVDLNKRKANISNRNEKASENKQVAIKKRRSKAPVMLPNNTVCNPYTKIKLGKKGPDARLVARDPRFSDFSGTLNEDMFRKSYAFLDEMRQNEFREIKAALRAAGEGAAGPGPKNVRNQATALARLQHMNISSVEDAKRALDRYKIQSQQLQSDEDLRKFKKELIEEEKEKIATTSKTPFFYSQKTVKRIYREKQKAKERAALASAAINSAATGDIHKKLARSNKRQLKRQPKLGVT